MTVEQLIKALQDMVNEDEFIKWAPVVNTFHSPVRDPYWDEDINGHLVVVLDW